MEENLQAPPAVVSVRPLVVSPTPLTVEETFRLAFEDWNGSKEMIYQGRQLCSLHLRVSPP